MGYSRSTSSDWMNYSATTSAKPAAAIFKNKTSMDNEMSGLDVGVREARDSDLNPESTAIYIGVDVTGSMGFLSEELVKKGLPKLFTEIYDRKPVTDPQVMVSAIGDATMYDRAPFQVGQFEADITASEWLEKVFIEGGGGGNGFESYDLPVYFAAYHTSIDCWEKRKQKGFLFTIGDEPPPPRTVIDAVKQHIASDGDGLEATVPFKEVIEAAQKMYHYFHIMIAEGYHAQHSPNEVKEGWRELLGERAIWLQDHKALGETIISILQVLKGEKVEDVANSWSGDTALVVRDAIKDLTAEDAYTRAQEVIRF